MNKLNSETFSFNAQLYLVSRIDYVSKLLLKFAEQPAHINIFTYTTPDKTQWAIKAIAMVCGIHKTLYI